MNQKHTGIDQCCKALNGVYKDEMEGIEMDRLQSFIKYNQKIFSIDDQHRLAKTINEIKEIGAHYILTNAAHHEIVKIFKGKDDKMVEIKRASLIGGKNAVRGKYAELIITNKDL